MWMFFFFKSMDARVILHEAKKAAAMRLIPLCCEGSSRKPEDCNFCSSGCKNVFLPWYQQHYHVQLSSPLRHTGDGHSDEHRGGEGEVWSVEDPGDGQTIVASEGVNDHGATSVSALWRQMHTQKEN
ncbi:hypothetical protein INR49_012234, partial [Caranx melampygus]